MQIQNFNHKGLRQLYEDDNAKGVQAMKNPPHPGSLIRTEIIEVVGLSVTDVAEVLKVRRATLSDLLNGKAALSPDMALRIEKAFGPKMEHLLEMQLVYDVAQARARACEIDVRRYEPA